MKRQTALKNLDKVITRLHGINGIYCTPLCYDDFIKVKRAWVFGSVAKGSQNPNDLDIFIEIHRDFGGSCQPRRKSQRKMFRRTASQGLKLHGGFKENKRSRRLGTPTPLSSTDQFCKWLKAGSRNVSLHFVHDDEVFERLDCKYLIYPRNDFVGMEVQPCL